MARAVREARGTPGVRVEKAVLAVREAKAVCTNAYPELLDKMENLSEPKDNGKLTPPRRPSFMCRPTRLAGPVIAYSVPPVTVPWVRPFSTCCPARLAL